MTISDEAKQAARTLSDELHSFVDSCEVIQQAIDLHERNLLGMGLTSMTPEEYVSVIKNDSAAFERLHDYIAKHFGVKGNHSVYEDIDCAKEQLDHLTKLNAELQEYVCHAGVCVVSDVRDLTHKSCTCGLAQLLEKMK